jgi:hypothetical protein
MKSSDGKLFILFYLLMLIKICANCLHSQFISSSKLKTLSTALINKEFYNISKVLWLGDVEGVDLMERQLEANDNYRN